MSRISRVGVFLTAVWVLGSWMTTSVAEERKGGFLARKADPSVKPANGTAPAPDDKWKSVVATVNGEDITRAQLADELLETHGRKQLEILVNRKIIEQSCKAKKIDVTVNDIESDLQEKLKRNNLKRKEFIDRVLAGQDMTYSQYVRDTVWPALALKKMVAGSVKVTDEDLMKSFEANYGPKVEVRMLVVMELRKSQELWEEINQEKDKAKRLVLFEDLCKTHSIDQATRSFGGKTQPIGKHTGYPEIEKLAFSLKEGDLSKIIQVPEGHLMLLCVQHFPARADVKMDTPIAADSKETVRNLLEKDLKEKKTRVEIATVFKKMREDAVINDFLTGEFDAQAIKQAGHAQPDPTAEQSPQPESKASAKPRVVQPAAAKVAAPTKD